MSGSVLLGAILKAAICVVAVGAVGCTGGAGDQLPPVVNGTYGVDSGTSGSAASLEDYTSRLNDELPDLMERYDVPGVAVALVRQGRLVWTGSYGYADRRERVPMTVNTVVREVSEKSFSDYMRNRVLAPLSMHASDFAWRSAYTDTIGTGHELDGDPVPAYIYPAGASGGLFSTVEDLGLFVAATVSSGRLSQFPQFDVEALQVPRVEITGLFSFVADSYGYGHFVERLPDGRHAVWHGGQGHGWMTHFHAVPDTGDGIVVVTNSQRSRPLMAEVLAGWSRWADVGSVKFARVVHAGTMARLLVGALSAAAMAQIIRLFLGIRTGRRRCLASLKGATAVGIIQALTGLGLAALLIWRATLPYVFESSIFPTLVGWAAVTVAALSAVLLISAACPVVPPDEPSGHQRGERMRTGSADYSEPGDAG